MIYVLYFYLVGVVLILLPSIYIVIREWNTTDTKGFSKMFEVGVGIVIVLLSWVSVYYWLANEYHIYRERKEK